MTRSFAAAALALALCAVLPNSPRAETTPASAPAALHQPDATTAHGHGRRCAKGTDLFVRTELFFGLSRPGGVVTEAEFQTFVDVRVTPRFPDGLTLLSGIGQFRVPSGTILVEGSKLLILLRPPNDPQAERSIEQIRDDYKRQFQQQSVLRADDLSCVSL
jgi:Protein of unknown function (DUF3574)